MLGPNYLKFKTKFAQKFFVDPTKSMSPKEFWVYKKILVTKKTLYPTYFLVHFKHNLNIFETPFILIQDTTLTFQQKVWVQKNFESDLQKDRYLGTSGTKEGLGRLRKNEHTWPIWVTFKAQMRLRLYKLGVKTPKLYKKSIIKSSFSISYIIYPLKC